MTVLDFRINPAIRRALCAGIAGAICTAEVETAFAQADPCQSINDQIQALRTQEQNEKDDFRDNGDHTGPSRKPIAAKIRQIERHYAPLIAAKRVAYDQCRFAHGGKPDEASTFTGTVTMTTNNVVPQAQGPFHLNFTLGLTFLKYDHTKANINNFPTLPFGPFPVGTGSPPPTNTTTVTLQSVDSVTVNPQTGVLRASITLKFAESQPLAGDSSLPIVLSTDTTGGSRIDVATRHLTLAGSGTFQHGFFGGNTGNLVIDGTLSTLP